MTSYQPVITSRKRNPHRSFFFLTLYCRVRDAHTPQKRTHGTPHGTARLFNNTTKHSSDESPRLCSAANQQPIKMLRPSSRTEARKKGFKKSIDPEEARRKREEGMIQIRKDKREEAFLKKRRCVRARVLASRLASSSRARQLVSARRAWRPNAAPPPKPTLIYFEFVVIGGFLPPPHLFSLHGGGDLSAALCALFSCKSPRYGTDARCLVPSPAQGGHQPRADRLHRAVQPRGQRPGQGAQANPSCDDDPCAPFPRRGCHSARLFFFSFLFFCPPRHSS
jgi:hypothetical protein